MTRFAEVAVQLPVPGTYHYQVPPRLLARTAVGCRVLVPFGARGVTGVVVRLADEAPAEAGEVRALDDLLDDAPPLDGELIGLCLWIADYYEAPPGEVLRAALPAGTRVSAARFVELTETGEGLMRGEAGGALTRRELEVLGRLAAAGGSLAQRALVRGGVRTAELSALVDAGTVRYASTRRAPRVRARTTATASLVRPPSDDERAALARSPRRLAALDALMAAGGPADVAALNEAVPRAGVHLKALAAAGLVELGSREVRRGVAAPAPELGGASAVPPELHPAQAAALAAVREAVAASRFQSFLLHGITGSGKTEVYLHAIAEVLAAGGGAIALVPEISLTPQLAARFRARFGDQVAVLHSGLGDGERFDEWHRLRSGSARIALGARSAVFAPVRRLGIIVVDEEHDSSFKQEEGVRYHARDVALVRAQRAGAACILGSATPSLESFHAAEQGRHRLLALPERATARPLPEVELVDLRTWQPEGEAMLTAPLITAITETLAAGDQVILFLNRRGFATFVCCGRCGHAFRCPHCSVSLTYHRARERLLCHYCGHGERLRADCPACGGKDAIVRRGLGTEKIAAAVAERFAGARVGRLDRDTGGGAGAERVLARMARRELDILVGTQMVAKGHDFPAVTLVGVLCADTGLNLPDFRASERTFQLLTQVAGRAGRGSRPGRVLIQSYRTEVTAVAAARTHDYLGFYGAECAARAELGYPPFGHLIAIRLDGTDGDAVRAAAGALATRAAGLPDRERIAVLGPAEAPLARLKGRTRWQVWLRAPERKPLRAFARQLVRGAAGAGVRVTVDVDPLSAL